MSKTLWVGMAVAMSCASVMASTIVTTETTTPTGTIHIPDGATITAGGVIDNFDAARNAGTWHYGDTVGGQIYEGGPGNPNPAPHGLIGVQADDPGSSAGNYAFMYSGNTLGQIASAISVPLLTPSTYVAFDFNYVTGPSLVELFLTDGNGKAWYTTINLGTPGTWNSYLVWLNPGQDAWYDKGNPPHGASSYASDFANIGSYYLGLNILYPDQSPDSYFVDNFEMGHEDTIPPVPEPGTMSMLGCALASMGLTFRRRLRSFFKG